jgi:hypothetical protein
VNTHKPRRRIARIGGIGALLTAATVLTVPAWGAPAMGATTATTRPAPQSVTTPDPVTSSGVDAAQATPMGQMQPYSTADPSPEARAIAAARMATAKYATNLAKAKADGYRILTMMMPDMGYHFVNPKIQGFDVRKPPILVYEHTGTGWQLGALEWVFTSMPKNPPLPNATFGSFPAACHYNDGTFVPEPSAAKCPAKAPRTGAAFFFWHPALVTMHVWVWYPNPAGLFSSTNPLVTPFNRG